MIRILQISALSLLALTSATFADAAKPVDIRVEVSDHGGRSVGTFVCTADAVVPCAIEATGPSGGVQSITYENGVETFRTPSKDRVGLKGRIVLFDDGDAHRFDIDIHMSHVVDRIEIGTGHGTTLAPVVQNISLKESATIPTGSFDGWSHGNELDGYRVKVLASRT